MLSPSWGVVPAPWGAGEGLGAEGGPPGQGEKNHGFDVLYHNMKHGQISTKELADFVRERYRAGGAAAGGVPASPGAVPAPPPRCPQSCH